MSYNFQIPKVLKAFELWIKDKGYAGRVGSVTLPKLAIKTSEYMAGGMDAPIDMDMGMGKLTAALTINEYSPEVISLFGLGNRAPFEAVLKGALDDESGSIVPMEVEMRGMITELDMGSWSPGAAQSLSLSLTLEYYEVTIDKEQIIEIDIKNFIRRIGDKDVLEDRRGKIWG